MSQEERTANTKNNPAEQALEKEMRKTRHIWDELQRVGKSWESQAEYIASLEKQRGEQSEALKEAHGEILKLLSVVLADKSEATGCDESIEDLFSLSGKPNRVQVALCYALFFGRLPEHLHQVDGLLEKLVNRKELLNAFIMSAEAKTLYNNLIPRPFKGDEPAMSIESDLSEKQMNAFFANTQKTWTAFGDSEPHWSVMTDERFKSGQISEQLQLFMDSGKVEAQRFLHTLSRNGIDKEGLKSLMDFGCGVGRVCSHFSSEFDTVHGVDISRNHLRIAEEYCAGNALKNMNFLHLSSLQDLDDLPNVDVVFSVIVLQHNPPPVSQFILGKLLQKLNPGGVAYFQVPTYMDGYSFDPKSYLKWSAKSESMEMHPISQSTVFAMADKANASVLEVYPDQWCQELEGMSCTFLIRKKN